MASTGRQAHRRPRPLRDVAVRSADPFEARAVGTRVYHDHRLEVLGDARAFAMNLEAASIGPVTIGWLTYDTEVRIETPEFADSYQVNLLTGGVMSARCGDQEITATPGRAMVYRPDRPTGFSGWRTPEPLLALKVERRALEHALERLLDRPVERPIAFSLGFDVGGGRGAQWSGLLHAATAALAREDSLREPGVPDELGGRHSQRSPEGLLERANAHPNVGRNERHGQRLIGVLFDVGTGAANARGADRRRGRLEFAAQVVVGGEQQAGEQAVDHRRGSAPRAPRLRCGTVHRR